MNTDGSFTMAISNSFLSPLEKNHTAADLEKFSVIFFLYTDIGVLCVLIRIALDEVIVMRTHNIPSC